MGSDSTFKIVGGSFTSKVPNRTKSTKPEKLRVESLTWSLVARVAHSSSQSCILVSIAKRNLLTNSVSLDSLALKMCSYFSITRMRALMLVVAKC